MLLKVPRFHFISPFLVLPVSPLTNKWLAETRRKASKHNLSLSDESLQEYRKLCIFPHHLLLAVLHMFCHFTMQKSIRKYPRH